MTKTIYVLNGPNMNLLGKRQPELYGSQTLNDVEKSCSAIANGKAFKIDLRQSNSEADLIDWIHEARNTGAGIVINPAAYSHTSIAIMDALMAFEGPVIEVHVSNIHKRERISTSVLCFPESRWRNSRPWGKRLRICRYENIGNPEK